MSTPCRVCQWMRVRCAANLKGGSGDAMPGPWDSGILGRFESSCLAELGLSGSSLEDDVPPRRGDRAKLCLRCAICYGFGPQLFLMDF